MDAVAILRQLWRSRLVVALGLALALMVGMAVVYRIDPRLPPTFESRQYSVGIASAAALVDSERSQVVDLGGGATRADVAVLSVRARLLANLLATSPLKDEIGARARVRPDWLIAHPPAEGGPIATRTPEGPSATIPETDPRAVVLRLHVNETLPIITAEVVAPDAATAARVAGASVSVLRRHLQAVSAADRVPDARKLVVTKLGGARSATQTRGGGRLLGIALFCVLFAIWCVAIVLVTGLARAWRDAAADGQIPPPPVPAPPPGGAERGPEPEPPHARAGATVSP
jgi:hypothetical protein